MEKRSSSIITPLIVLAIGVIMICLFKGNFIEWLIEGVGVVIILLAVYNIITVFTRRNEATVGSRSGMLVASVLTGALGIWVICQPLFFEKLMVFVFAFALLVASVGDIAFMRAFARPAKVPWFFFIVPVLVIIAAIIMVVTPVRTINTTVVLITGICLAASGLNRLVNALMPAKKA